MTVVPFGEAALLVEVGGAERAQRLAADLRATPPPGVLGIVPGRASVLVELDPFTAGGEAVPEELRRRERDLADGPLPGRRRTIPVMYGGELGPDLSEVARIAGLDAAEVVALHAGAKLRVLFGGFAPGFAYIGELPAELHVDRLRTPRTRTPRGAVALADGMTGVYPADLPGGWRVIGQTPVTLFDPTREPPAYLVPGDLVRFVPIDADDWDAHAGLPADW